MIDLSDIPGSENFTKTEFINKGWSDDKKYYIETSGGEKLLLRVSDIAELERKQGEYNMLKRVSAIGIKTNTPVDFGYCGGGKSIYQLLKWLDGEDLESALPKFTDAEQCELGIKSGKLLQKIHTLSAPENAELWSVRFRQKIKHCTDVYNSNDFKSPHIEPIIKYLHDNIYLLDSRPQTFIHGDFWVANLIVNSDKEIGVIDFNYYNSAYGDPWSELGYTLPWDGTPFYSCFFINLFNGYFDGSPPIEFFKILRYYYAFSVLAATCDIADNDGEKREICIKNFENIVYYFGDFQNDIPLWYLKDYTKLKK
jgi:serine/threonine-protein kinase